MDWLIENYKVSLVFLIIIKITYSSKKIMEVQKKMEEKKSPI